MQYEQNQEEKIGCIGWITIFIFGLLVIHFFYYWTFGLYSQIKEEKEENEAYIEERAEGIETYALVTDKKSYTYRGGSERILKLYIQGLDKEYQAYVNVNIYDYVRPNDYIEVVVKDEFLYFGKKDDKENTLRFVDKEVVNQEEQIKK